LSDAHERPRRSLVIAPQWVGDAIMSEPFVRALQESGDEVTVAAMPWVAPVCEAFASAHAVITLPLQRSGLQWSARRAVAKEWSDRFDAAWVLPNSFKSALLPRLAGIPQRHGYHGESRWPLLNRRLPNPDRALRPPMVTHYLALAREFAGQGLPAWAKDTSEPRPELAQQDPRAPQLCMPADSVAKVWQDLGLTLGEALVIAPGAEYGPAKRWPVSHLAEVITRIDRPVVLLGSPKERDLSESIMALLHERVRARVHNLTGQTTLTQAMALVAGAHRVLSNDSGVMHMAAGLGVPQVAVFGSSSPLHTPPLNALARVIWLKGEDALHPPLDCAPCFARECRYGHTRCLTEVTPQRVMQALSEDFLSAQPLHWPAANEPQT
jgi:heptosyltransferase-2